MSAIFNKPVDEIKAVVKTAPVPAFPDIAKAANDLLGKDFYHVAAANLEVKAKAPNGVAYTVKGKSAHSGPIAASLEGKYDEKKNGMHLTSVSYIHPTRLSSPRDFLTFGVTFLPQRAPPKPWAQSRMKPAQPAKPTPSAAKPTRPTDTGAREADAPAPQPLTTQVLMQHRTPGVTSTLLWTTANTIDLKVEAKDNITKGLKAEALATFKPDAQPAPAAGKLNFYFQQPQYHVRAFADLLKGPSVNADVVLGHGGFVVGGEAGYDVQQAALTRWSLAAGYLSGAHSAAVTGSNNLSVYTASFFHKVNADIQAGAKATYNTKNSGAVGLELATRYQLDPTTFAKAKINDRGVAAVSYNTNIRQGFTFGVGASFDTQKLNEATHTIGTHFAFEA